MPKRGKSAPGRPATERFNANRWRERECRFDIKYSAEPTFTCGEVLIDSLNNVEDTKGNNGQAGRLMVTNLRLLWYSYKNLHCNLSIGFRAIFANGLRRDYAPSRLRGRAQALHVSARNQRATGMTRYQFIFTNLVEGSPRLFTTIQAVFKAYDTTRIYREWKIRSAITKDMALNLLPEEEIEEELSGVMSISGADAAMLGSLTWTNIRVTWVNATNELHNFSLPYMQMESVGFQTTKYGDLLVMKVRSDAGGHTLGLRIGSASADQILEYARRIQNAFDEYCLLPEFGVRFSQHAPPALAELTVQQEDDDVDIIGEGETQDAFASYYADLVDGGDTADQRPPVYSDDLGLAIEQLRPDLTIAKLWQVQ